jgi:hypothetical protein
MRSFYILFFIIFQSCGHKQNRRIGHEKELPFSTNTMISIIENSDCVYGDGIGMTSEKSITYECFKRLEQLASDSLWFQLSKSKSTVMRIYAYKALLSKNQSLALQVKERLKNDKSPFCDITDDQTMYLTVDFFVTKLSDTTTKNNWFTK